MEPTANVNSIAQAVNAATVAVRPAKRKSRSKVVEVRLVTINQLEKILLGINGAKAVMLLARTQVKMRKTGNPFYNLVYKEQEHNVFLNFNYAKAVNRQREREGNTFPFLAHPRKWGVRLPYTCMVLHNNQYYMEAKVERTAGKQYFYRGRPIQLEQFNEYVIQPSEPKTQALVNPIIVRDYNTISIMEVTIDGIRYRVKDSSRRARIRENSRHTAATAAAMLAAVIAPEALARVVDGVN